MGKGEMVFTQWCGMTVLSVILLLFSSLSPFFFSLSLFLSRLPCFAPRALQIISSLPLILTNHIWNNSHDRKPRKLVWRYRTLVSEEFCWVNVTLGTYIHTQRQTHTYTHTNANSASPPCHPLHIITTVHDGFWNAAVWTERIIPVIIQTVQTDTVKVTLLILKVCFKMPLVRGSTTVLNRRDQSKANAPAPSGRLY